MIVNSCGQLPATVTSVKEIAGVASHISVAVALPVFAGAVLAVHSTVMLAGQLTNGARLSSMVMTCMHELLLYIRQGSLCQQSHL